MVECLPEVEVIYEPSGCAPVSIKNRWGVSFKRAIRGIGNDVDPLCFLSSLSSSNVNFFLLSCHCGLDG